VERDHESTERLKDNLTKNLPDVDTQAIETDVRSWRGPDVQVDLVLLFNTLYYLDRKEQQDLYHKLHQHWLSKGGFVAIVHASKRIAPLELWKVLGNLPPMWEDIASDMLEAGFSKVHEYEMLIVNDHSEADEELLYLYQAVTGRPITSDELRHALKTVSPDGKWQQSYCIVKGTFLKGTH